MKTNFLLLVLAACASFSGCSYTKISMTDRQEEIKTFSIDFRKYAEAGFLFTPNEFLGEYQVKGIITAELHPEVKYQRFKQAEKSGFMVRYIYSQNELYTQTVKNASMEELIDFIYNLSIEWGGDAFTQFETTMKTAKTDDSESTSYTYYSITGLVIKRNR